jgi:hypothetical protein
LAKKCMIRDSEKERPENTKQQQQITGKRIIERK